MSYSLYCHSIPWIIVLGESLGCTAQWNVELRLPRDVLHAGKMTARACLWPLAERIAAMPSPSGHAQWGSIGYLINLSHTVLSASKCDEANKCTVFLHRTVYPLHASFKLMEWWLIVLFTMSFESIILKQTSFLVIFYFLIRWLGLSIP